MVIDTGSGETFQRCVLRSESLEEAAHLNLALCLRDVILALEAYAVRHIGRQSIE